MEHPVADFAKEVMQLAVAGTGIRLSDGSTNIIPVGDNVENAWTLHGRLVRRSLESGYYQGWDLHAAQLPSRFAADVRVLPRRPARRGGCACATTWSAPKAASWTSPPRPAPWPASSSAASSAAPWAPKRSRRLPASNSAADRLAHPRLAHSTSHR